ncbi:MAG: hypothetical protein ACOC5K_04835, partial [Chloroflexota bacterium]
MQRALRIFTLAAFAVAAVFTIYNGSSAQAADGQGDGPVRIIAIDLGSASMGERDAAMAESAARVLSDTTSGTVALMPYGAEAEMPSAYPAGSDELAESLDELAARLADTSGDAQSDQFEALTNAYRYLSENSAPEGADVYLVTGRMQDGSEENRERIVGFSDLFVKEGWNIHAVMLPSAAPEARDFLSSIVERASGSWADAGTTENLAQFVHRQYGMSPRTALSLTLEPGATAVRAVDVPPETERLTVTMMRQSSDAEVSVFDPHGVELSPSSSRARFTEAPNFVVASVEQPEPGTWSLRATGDGMPVLAAVEQHLPVELQLLEQPPLPTGETGTLRVASLVNGEPSPVPGATVRATVNNPEGSGVVYELNDEGQGADETAGDGIHSVEFTTGSMQGVNNVALELEWANYDTARTGNGTFKTEVFPSARIETSDVEVEEDAGSAPLGVVEVMVGQYPYPVRPDIVDVQVVGPDGEEIDHEVDPVSTLDDGTAWQYQVTSNTAEAGEYSLSASLEDEYLGRSFSASAGPSEVSVSTPSPASTGESGVGPAASEGEEGSGGDGTRSGAGITGSLAVPGESEPDTQSAQTPDGGIPMTTVLMGVGALAALLSTVASGLFARKVIKARNYVEPYGFLYDDYGTLVSDLSSVRKTGLSGWLSRGAVSAMDVRSFPVPGATFVFTKDGIELQYDNTRGRTLRVNGVPAGRSVSLTDGARIGFAGRLYVFSTSPRYDLDPPLVYT